MEMFILSFQGEKKERRLGWPCALPLDQSLGLMPPLVLLIIRATPKFSEVFLWAQLSTVKT